MNRKNLRIHKEGYRFIFWVGLSLLILNVAFQYFWPDENNLQLGLGILSIATFVFIVSFFRNPFREIAEEEEAVIAPADGKIVVIEEVFEKEYFNDKRLQISIFMSPANVHVNRTPIDGTIAYTKYHPGKYLVAWHPKSSEKNERHTIVIKHEEGDEILLRQIAGKLARKIVNYTEEGKEYKRGDEFGFIKFGSRVDLFLPLDARINVSLNQKVKGGQSILAYLE